MAGDSKRHQNMLPAAVWLALILFSLPLLVLVSGVVEEAIWGTANVAGICQRVGIYKPLKVLLDAVLSLLGILH